MCWQHAFAPGGSVLGTAARSSASREEHVWRRTVSLERQLGSAPTPSILLSEFEVAVVQAVLDPASHSRSNDCPHISSRGADPELLKQELFDIVLRS